MTDMTADWIIHVKIPSDFKRSSPKSIWGYKHVAPGAKKFEETIKSGDRLWLKRTGGVVFAVATFERKRCRELGPLVSVSLTDEELGWEGGSERDIEIHYSTLFTLSRDVIIITDKSNTTFKEYTQDCGVNLPHEYLSISKYAPSTFDCIEPLLLPVRSDIIGGCDARKLRYPYVQGVGRPTLYKSERCGKSLHPGSHLCERCCKIEEKFKKTCDPATGNSPHHITWNGVMSKPPPSWAHVEGTQWHIDSER